MRVVALLRRGVLERDVDDSIRRVIGEGRPSAAARGRSTARGHGVRLRPADQSRRAGTRSRSRGREEAHEEARQQAADQLPRAVENVRIREVRRSRLPRARSLNPSTAKFRARKEIEHRPLVELFPASGTDRRWNGSRGDEQLCCKRSRASAGVLETNVVGARVEVAAHERARDEAAAIEERSSTSPSWRARWAGEAVEVEVAGRHGERPVGGRAISASRARFLPSRFSEEWNLSRIFREGRRSRRAPIG